MCCIICFSTTLYLYLHRKDLKSIEIYDKSIIVKDKNVDYGKEY